jgi:cytochrome c biogenesis protein CcdA
MPPSDIQPPRQYTQLDDDIREAKEEVRHFRLLRNSIWGTIFGWAIIEVVLILIPVITHYKDWIYAPYIWGIAVPLFGGMFASLALSEMENPYNRSALIAAETRLERLKSKQREQSTGRGKSKTALYQRYKESMPELVERYRLVANHYRNIYNTLQAFIIIGSLLASTFVGAFEPAHWARWAAVILASAVGISSAIGAHFKLNERSSEMQKTADLIEIEFRAVEFGIGDYEELEPEEALRKFVETVERIRTEHMTQKRKLDQPSDVRFVDSSSIN